MDTQILAAEREAHQRSKRTARMLLWGGMGGLFVLVGLVLTVSMWGIMGAGSLFLLLIFLGVFGLSLGLSVLAAKGMGSSYNNRFGVASGGPWSFGQVYTQAPAEQVWASLHHAAGISGMGSHQVGPTTIEAVKPMGFWTPGSKYLIDLRPSADRPGWGVVTIAARPQIAYAFHDMGIAQNMVNSMLMAVPGRELPGVPRPALPATPQDRFQSSRPELPSADAARIQAPMSAPGQHPHGQPAPGFQPASQPNQQQHPGQR